MNIYAYGCSCTVGAGVQEDEKYLSILGELTNATELKNFGKAGHSNDFISRTLVESIELDNPPDLVVVLFTRHSRAEFINTDGEIKPFIIHKLKLIKDKPESEYTSEEIDLWSYYNLYNDYIGAYSFLKSVLLCQLFLEQYKIPYIFSSIVLQEFPPEHLMKNPTLNSFISKIDWTKFIQFEFKDKGYDNAHPGVLSHKQFAKNIYGAILK